jgi:hypothetical protein
LHQSDRMRLADAIREASAAAARTKHSQIIYRDASGAIGYAPELPHGSVYLLRITPQRGIIVPGRKRSE